MANVVGNWTLTTDWSGSIGSFEQTFNADGTWTAAPYAGRWFQNEGLVIWTYDTVANLIYAANLSGEWMSGIQGYPVVGGIKGTFGGHLASVPAALAKEAKAPARKVDPRVGK